MLIPKRGIVTPKNVIDVIKKNKLRKIKALVIMHLGGKVENIDNFFYLKKKCNFYLVEDSCHALEANIL